MHELEQHTHPRSRPASPQAKPSSSYNYLQHVIWQTWCHQEPLMPSAPNHSLANHCFLKHFSFQTPSLEQHSYQRNRPSSPQVKPSNNHRHDIWQTWCKIHQ
jgi:hypothetical protein